jgi:hypothetical protein
MRHSTMSPDLLTSPVSADCHRCGVIDTPKLGPGSGPHVARALCAHCGAFLAWLSRFPLSGRQARRQQARQAAMAIKAPSPAQLDYLQALRDSSPPPTSMAEASQRIDALKREVIR